LSVPGGSGRPVDAFIIEADIDGEEAVVHLADFKPPALKRGELEAILRRAAK
jgi:hypothetical protein